MRSTTSAVSTTFNEEHYASSHPQALLAVPVKIDRRRIVASV
jgi:hypothetical protein